MVNSTNTVRDFKIEKRKVRFARITVHDESYVEMIIPLKFSQGQIDLLIKDKTKWIQKQLDYFRKKKETSVKPKSGEIMFLGKIYKFKLIPELDRECKIDDDANTLSTGLDLMTAEVLDKWYKNEAKRIINERLKYLTTKHRFSYNRVFIRAQKTLWGSCSANNNLSFNWKLIQTPLFILDYIVIHELIHTVIFNHTKEYWDKVASICPDYKKANKWLKDFTPVEV